jgi:hypothetical protein
MVEVVVLQSLESVTEAIGGGNRNSELRSMHSRCVLVTES